MGAWNSKPDEDKALQLCRERKKFVKQALDGRCSLASAHYAYVQSLRNTGTALKKFADPGGAPVESSLNTSNGTPGPLALTEKSAPSLSQHVDDIEIASLSTVPHSSSRFQANYMRVRGSSSRKVEEKLTSPVIGSVYSSSASMDATPHSSEWAETSSFGASAQHGDQSWDYFGFSHPIDHQFSFQGGKGVSQGFEDSDDIRQHGEEDGIPELEDEEEDDSFHGVDESTHDSEDGFDEPAADTLVRSFQNYNRTRDHGVDNTLPGEHSTRSAASETKLLNGKKSNSPDLSPLRSTSSVVPLPTEMVKDNEKEGRPENVIAPKDFFASICEIQLLFVKASDSGKEVPRMLQADMLILRPLIPRNENHGSAMSTFLKACFSCGEDPSIVQEETAQTAIKYLTLGANSKDETQDHTGTQFDNSCMISGHHASTLDRLYAWERKLYDEVKASEMVRRDYDSKCKLLRQLESKEVSLRKTDKIRASVKDLHSRIRVSIHRIDSISKRIEELRDKELLPQLEELIERLNKMWEVMSECHKRQFEIISSALNNGSAKILVQSETHRQNTTQLENELTSMSSNFMKWISWQKSYLESINEWLFKCVTSTEKLMRGKKKKSKLSHRDYLRRHGPPIYVTCGVWLEKLDALETKDVADSMKGLATEVARFLPRQENGKGSGTKGDSGADLMNNGASEDMTSGVDRFQTSLVGFFVQLSSFSDCSVKMYADIKKSIEEGKKNYEQLMARRQAV